jgi:hypothetical protein
MTQRIPQARLEGTNAADLMFSVTVKGVDPTTGLVDTYDISAWSITFTIQDKQGVDRVTATVNDMLELTGDEGEFAVQIPAATMNGLAPGSYKVGCIGANNLATVQIFEGQLSIKDGVAG